jgi:hypothetical protein
MSGYLARLAQRTLQSSTEIHSTVKLPYASQPVMHESESILGNRNTVPEAMNNLQPNPMEMLFEVDMRARSERRPDHDSINEAINNAPKSNLQFQHAEKSNQIDFENETVKPNTLGSGYLPMQSEVRELQKPSLNNYRIDDFEPLVKTPDQVDGSVNTQISFNQTEKAVPETGALSNLPKPSPIGDRSIKAFEAKITDSNEVHVTIGRIEITALNTSPISKPVQAPTRKTMSLDEYLAKRNGERS